MNLKEAFRYQNKLEWLMGEAKAILGREQNVTKVENTALRQKIRELECYIEGVHLGLRGRKKT